MILVVPDMVIDRLASVSAPRKLPAEDPNNVMIVNNYKRDEKLDYHATHNAHTNHDVTNLL